MLTIELQEEAPCQDDAVIFGGSGPPKLSRSALDALPDHVATGWGGNSAPAHGPGCRKAYLWE